MHYDDTPGNSELFDDPLPLLKEAAVHLAAALAALEQAAGCVVRSGCEVDSSAVRISAQQAADELEGVIDEEESDRRREPL